MGNLSARRALLHPAWLAAAGVLLVNDHVLKGAGILPSWATGKLSDVAGLFLAPALASTLVFARSRRAVMAVHVLVAVVFAAVKTIPAFTLGFEHLLSLFVRSRVWTDPTDLLALPAVVLSWRVLLPWMEDASQAAFLRKAAQTAACGAGAIMCMATSEAVPSPLTIHNQSKERVTVTVRSLSSTVRIDEKIVFSSTPLPLTPALFDPAGSGGVVAIDPGGKLDSQTLGARVLLVDISSGGKGSEFVLARSSNVTSFDIGSNADGTFSVTSSEGASIRDLSETKTCASAPPKGVDYSLPVPLNGGTIASIGQETNGCFDVELENTGVRMRVCMPRDAWPFAVGDQISVNGSSIVGGPSDALITLDFEKAQPERVTVDLSCGTVDMCGTIALGTEMTLSDGTKVSVGGDHTVGDTRWLVGRLESLPVVNSACKDLFPNDAIGLHSSIVRIQTQSLLPDAGADGAAEGGLDAGSD